MKSQYALICEEADRLIRARFDSAYEILIDDEHHCYVVACPRNWYEGGEADQPTAVWLGDLGDYTNAEDLYEDAIANSDICDELYVTEPEWEH